MNARHTLKPEVVNEAKRQNLLSAVAADEAKLNNLVDKLRSPEIGIAIDDVETLSKVSHEWVKGYMTDAYNKFINNLGFVPKGIKDGFIEEFNKVGKRADGLCNAVRNLLDKYKGIEVRKTADGFAFDGAQVLESVTERSKRHFTPLQREYYKRLGSLVDALNEVAAFEDANDLKRFVINGSQFNVMSGDVLKYVDVRSVGKYFAAPSDGDVTPNRVELTPKAFAQMIDAEGIFYGITRDTPRDTPDEAKKCASNAPC